MSLYERSDSRLRLQPAEAPIVAWQICCRKSVLALAESEETEVRFAFKVFNYHYHLNDFPIKPVATVMAGIAANIEEPLNRPLLRRELFAQQ